MNLPSEFEEKLKMSERELLIEIGRNVGMFETFPPDDVAMEAGQTWFDSRLETFKRLVCVPAVRSGLNGTTSDLGLALTTCLTAAFGDFGVVHVAALLVKKGIHTMCDWKWQ